jgi:hypothetical protein
VEPTEYFNELCQHDWYYNYSDDFTVYNRGRANLFKLQSLAAENKVLGKMYEDYSAWAFDNEKPKPELKNYLRKK